MTTTLKLNSLALLTFVAFVLTTFAPYSYAQKEQKDKLIPLIFSDSDQSDTTVFASVNNSGGVDIIFCEEGMPCIKVTNNPIELNDLASVFPNEDFQGEPVKQAGAKDYLKVIGLSHLAGAAITFIWTARGFLRMNLQLSEALTQGSYLASFYLAGPIAFLLAPTFGAGTIAIIGTVAALSVAISVGAIYWGVQKYKGWKVHYQPLELDMAMDDFLSLANTYDKSLDSLIHP